MYLPKEASACMARLEKAGFPCYAVGGCVRDSLLGLTPHDYDLCTAATPAQIEEVFADHRLILTGEKHGTVSVITPEGIVEITAFRSEGRYSDNRHPDWVHFVTNIEDDLSRRDYTINAMAWSPTRGLCDPFGGGEDLTQKRLRAVGDPETRFREDSLRILRGVRFAVRYGLRVDAATEQAMVRLAPLMDNLARERVFDELCKLLPLVTAEDLLHFAPVLTQVIPELAPTVGFDQRSPHHCYDIYTHTAHVTAGVPADLALRWAALLHDTGKVAAFSTDETGRGHFYGHAQISADLADGLLLRLKAPTELRQRIVRLVDQHMTWLTPEKKALRKALSRLGPELMEDLLLLQQADTAGKGNCTQEELQQFADIRRLLAEVLSENACLSVKDLAVDGHDMMALGLTGPAIGQTLHLLLEQVIDERLPNEKEALLNAAKAAF